MKTKKQLNVFGNELQKCSINPVTGYFRDGCCSGTLNDSGKHIICAVVTDNFLKFSLKKGNDLITPREEFSFPGLVEGDRWCLCLDRWVEAYENNCAPKIILEATNKEVLKKVEMQILKRFAIDLN
tara:strand:+ start:2215 stop:2592 length:378 start_codon:yes stop_codon:yes gene_type:complete